MAAKSLIKAATAVARLKMYPYFDIANYILMCMMVREDSHRDTGLHDNRLFSRKHPLSCWVSSMVMCFASVILTNFITGESPIAPFTNHRDLLTASIVWYLINYAPFDIVYKFCQLLPIKIIIYTLKEIQRANKIQHGIVFAWKRYPGSYPVICLIGVIKGAGYYFMRIFDRLVRGVWIPSSNEILSPALATKASLAASAIFILHERGLLRVDANILYLVVVLCFIILRLLYLVAGVHDPFHPVENLFCGVFFGGMVDALKNAVQRGGGERPRVDEAPGPSVGRNQPNRPKED